MSELFNQSLNNDDLELKNLIDLTLLKLTGRPRGTRNCFDKIWYKTRVYSSI